MFLLPSVQVSNEDGHCWTCKELGENCDALLPSCYNCIAQNRLCGGYSVRLQWPKYVTKDRLMSAGLPALHFGSELSPFPVEEPQANLLRHYLNNFSKLALAIDYDENGYRCLLPMMEDPALLNAVLAVSASHRSKWQKQANMESENYLRLSVHHLRQRCASPTAVNAESVLATMLFLVAYEVFNGSARWRTHFKGICGWLRTHSPPDLSPFLKTWIALLETQTALNQGQTYIPEVENWLKESKQRHAKSMAVDPFFGCSTDLPYLMLEAAKLQRQVNMCGPNRTPVQEEKISQAADQLQRDIAATAIPISPAAFLAVTCENQRLLSPASDDMPSQNDVSITASAEIFRHALHVYVYRVQHGPGVALTQEIQNSVDTCFDLLHYIPDGFGPGSNLGWALVVIGSETSDFDRREFLRYMWRCIHMLALNNSHNAERLLNEVWNRRDLAASGGRQFENWQDVMNDIGEDITLI